MISRARARRIARALDPAGLARRAWRAAGIPPEGGRPQDAAVGLDLETGKLVVLACPVDEDPEPLASSVILLAVCGAAERELHTRRLSAGCAVPPSEEAIEEQMVRAAALHGTSWSRLEAQLDAVYNETEEGR